MEFDVLPGPSLAELARTALARAATAAVSAVTVPAGPAAAGPVPVRSTWDGNPVLLPPAGAPRARGGAAPPGPVRVALAAPPPFAALRLTGTARPVTVGHEAGITACMVTPGAVEFAGGGWAGVPVAEYRAARPDPLWRVSPGILRHLEQGHMSELVRCVRAHGLARAEWVVPRGLDRYGLELLVLATDGIAAVRLAFPDGPVACLDDMPASLRTALTCRCQAGGVTRPGWLPGPPGSR